MKHIFLTFTTLTLFSCYQYINVQSSNNNARRISMNAKYTNVCKELKEKVVLYFVFVDEKNNKKWSKFDINESKKAIKESSLWLKEQANKNNIELDLNTVYHNLKDSTHPIEKNLPYKSINNHLFYAKDGIKKLHKWSNNIAALANLDLRKSHKVMNRDVKSRDELIQNLQNIYQTENIALIYLMNNSVRKESSITLFTTESSSNENTTEYSIISEPKKASIITHEILHLFGADDFYNMQYSVVSIPKEMRKKFKQKTARIISGTNNKTCVLREYPNAVMRNINLEPLDSLQISPITKYLIGWEDKSQVSTRDKEFILYGDYIEMY